MKRTLLILAVFTLSIASLFSQGARADYKGYNPVTQEGYMNLVGEVIEISKYGNIYTSILCSDLNAAGYEEGDIALVKIGDSTFDMPIGTSYSDVDNGNPVIRLYASDYVELAINHGNLAGEAEASLGSPVLIGMLEKDGYKEEFLIRHLEKSEDPNDYTSDEVFANFRTIGQGDIPAGILYRGTNPVYGDARAPYADRLVGKNGIKSVVNLADSSDSATSHMAEAPSYSKIANEGNIVFLNLGIDFFSPEFTSGLKEGLLFIVNAPTPIYIHCNEGKDRAGMVFALLEALTGSTLDEIVADYMMSYENFNKVEKGTAQYDAIGGIIKEFLRNVNGGVAPSDAELKTMARSYLTNKVGLSGADVDKLVSKITGK